MPSEPIKVLHTVVSGQPAGINTFVVHLIRAIDRSRFHIGVCCLGADGPALDEVRSLGIEALVLDQKGHFGPRAIARYFRHIRSRGYRILHANAGARLPRGLAKLAGCRAVIAHAHGAPEHLVEEIRRRDPSLRRHFAIAFGAGSDSIVVCSRSVLELLATTCPGLMPRVCLIPNGVDLQPAGGLRTAETEERRRAGGLSQQSVLVGFLGRIIPLKRPDCLLAAAQTLIPRHPDLHFVLLGEGCLRTALEQQAVSVGARFQLLGDRPSSEWFPLIDILVLPSESEGLPFAVLEAMAWGKPVVASAVGGVPEAVVDGETGLLIPPGDVRALETALNTLICHPELRRQMGLAGRARAERLFDSRQMARSFENLYVRLSGRWRDSGRGFTPS